MGFASEYLSAYLGRRRMIERTATLPRRSRTCGVAHTGLFPVRHR